MPSQKAYAPSTQSLRLFIRYQHVFQEKQCRRRNVYHNECDQRSKNERADTIRPQEQVQQRVFAAACIPAAVDVSLFHNRNSFSVFD